MYQYYMTKISGGIPDFSPWPVPADILPIKIVLDGVQFLGIVTYNKKLSNEDVLRHHLVPLNS